MGAQLLAKTTMKGQLVKLSEEMQFEMVRQTMELMIHKKLLEEQKAKIEKELAGMYFVFHKTPEIPFKSKKTLEDESPYVSQSTGEFLTRVFRNTCSKGVFFVVLFMTIKFMTSCLNINVLDKVSNFISAKFLVLVLVVLMGCGLLSAAEILYKDKKNGSELEKINSKIAVYNRSIEQQNAVIRQKNLKAEEEDRKRRVMEEQLYQKKRRELQKRLQICKESYQKVLTGLAKIKERNVMPDMFFEEDNKLLSVVYYLMQNRITAKLYGTDGALEKARGMLQEKAMMNLVQQIVDNTARTVGQLDLLNSKISGVHDKLDSLGGQMESLSKSQKQMNCVLSDVSQSSQKTAVAIENQNKLWRKAHENKK